MSFLSYFANKKTSSTLLEVKIMEIRGFGDREDFWLSEGVFDFVT